MSTSGQKPGNELLGSPEAAAYLQTTERHLRRLRADHGLPCVRLGGKVRFLRSDLDDLVARLREIDTQLVERSA